MFWELSNLLLYFIKDFIKEECWGLLIGNVIAICFSGFLNHEIGIVDEMKNQKIPELIVDESAAQKSQIISEI